MSRAAAAQSSSTATSSTLLVLRDNPNGSSTALIRSEPNGHPVDVGALVMLLGLSDYSYQERIENRKKRLKREENKRLKIFKDYSVFTSHGGGIFKITSHLVWMRILNFLLHQNAFQNIPLVIPLEHFPSIDDQLDDLQSRALQTVRSAAPDLNVNFFSKNYAAGFEFACLLDAALNADLKMVEKILAEASPKNRQTFLSTPGSAVITHLGIERTGTPLQMALYSHDEKMVEVTKRHMDPAEFQRQSEAVFGPDYEAFLARQQLDATRLCSELENAFVQASAADITNALNHVPNTISALQDVLNRFEENLKRYVRENPVHNPYILQRLFEIYDRLPYDRDKECLLSHRPIGLMEKLSSAIWLSHISNGVYNLGKSDSPAAPSRGFLSLANRLDVRTLDRLGIDCYIDIFGRACGGRGLLRAAVESTCATLCGAGPLSIYKTYVEQKQQAFRTYYAASAIDSQLRNAMTLSR
jgi:hypothetical protein